MENGKIKWIAIFWALFAAANGQSSVVSPATIMTGGQYTLTCDISKITTQKIVNIIGSLTIYRQTSDAQTSPVAQYLSAPPPTINNISSNAPLGLSSTWNFTFMGANGGSNNKDSMRIIVNVQNAQCNDAAAFLCSTTFFYTQEGKNLQEIVNSNQQNLTVEAGTTIDPIGVDRNMVDANGEYVYIEGDNITLTCTVRGPASVSLSWELYIKNTEGGNDIQPSLPPGAQITSPPGTPTGGSGSCGGYNYVSTLMVPFAAQAEPKVYVCVAKRSQADLARANVTISVSGSATPAPQISDTSSADVGMIVGIVIGCVVFIAIIIVVIFVVRYRRNKSQGDTYKGNEDQRDSAGDNNLSAPPPVVYPYSKPTKGNKEKDEHKFQISAGETNEGLDNSYDSRDSTTRGPPRYANTEIENQEPPRYDTHRGRQNRAYDDEEREKTDRRHRDDSHEDRKHRSRGQNEPSRRRNYSTDDGNVDFGDPNMGTSI